MGCEKTWFKSRDSAGRRDRGDGLPASHSYWNLRHGIRNSRVPAIAFAIIWAWTANRLHAEQPLSVQLSPGTVKAAAPEQDDATLRDIAFLGPRVIWTVGDRGAIWRSDDAGESWQFLALPSQYSDCTLHSVCFLTDRIGWVAGGRIVPVARTSNGILLRTTDGGATWEPVSQTRHVYLRYVRFFDFDRGVVVGVPTASCPSGIMTTHDGGQTWQPVASQTRTSWTAAAFVSPEAGLVVGPRGLRGTVSGTQLMLSPGTGGMRELHALSIDPQGRGWAVGDGAILLMTDNAGASWVLPDRTLPRDLEDFCELKAVSHVGDNVWCAGVPGSVVWHSPDGGRTWHSQPTDGPSPLEAIRFADSHHGCAVGAFGRILTTADSGHTWRAARGQGRRLALLSVNTSAQRLPHQLITKSSREEGYRTAVTVITRHDIGPDAHAHFDQRLKLQQAVSAEGGAAVELAWRLPVAVPGLEQHREQLIREWSLLTDSRLGDLLLSYLVARLRMWRPDAVVIDEAGDGDATKEVLEEAMKLAVKHAADPAAYPQQAKYGLAPWQVRKLFARRSEGTSGTVRIDPYQVLPRCGTTLDQAVLRGAACMNLAADVLSPEQYQLLFAAGESTTAAQTLLGDLGLPFGSGARRDLPPMDSHNVDRLLEQAQQRRMVTALGQRMVQAPETASTLLAQLKDMVAPLSPAQAAQQLADIAMMHRRHGQLDLAEETYALLITEYRNQPAALEAMKWLVNHWTSVEVNWQRLRTMRGERTVVKTDKDILQANWEEAVKLLQEAETDTERGLAEIKSPLQSANSPLTLSSGDLHSVLGTGGKSIDQRALRIARWQEMAQVTMEHVIADRPELWSLPEVQFSYAALMRRRLQHQKADDIYGRFLSQISNDPWHQAARGETWLLRPGPVSPKPVMTCKRTSEPPILDGLLSDACWSSADEVTLSAQGETSLDTFVGSEKAEPGRVEFLGPQAIVMVSYDDRYLYAAVSVPRHPEGPSDRPLYPGRTHDADLTPFDRIILHFDVDRDYNTFYTFAVDQRAWTYEACWEDASYNPKWYVAADADERHWRIEAAIPLEELVPSRPTAQTWGLGITRIIPGLGSETWTNSGAEVPQPARFGLMQFAP